MKLITKLEWHDYHTEKPKEIYGEYFHGEFLIYFQPTDSNICFYDVYATDFETWDDLEEKEDMKILKYALLQEFIY